MGIRDKMQNIRQHRKFITVQIGSLPTINLSVPALRLALPADDELSRREPGCRDLSYLSLV